MTEFQIDHQCPQCGAPAGLEESDRLFTCSYCRVKSFLLTRDYFRYVLPAKNPAGKDLIYFPYWRFKGTLLFCLPAGNDHKFVDANLIATEAGGIPPTMGLRAQVLRLKFMSPDMPGCFVPPKRAFSEAFGVFQKRFSQTVPKPILYSAHLGESLGLLYSPFYAKDRLYDAVLDAPISRLPGGFLAEFSKTGKPAWRANFIPALCPDCGWDLEGERDALVLLCRNCSSTWYPSGEKLTRVEADCLSAAEEGLFALPFWQIAVDVRGMDLKHYADLLKRGNSPAVGEKDLAEQEFRFWTPAFKVRGRAFLRLAEGLTTIQIQDALAPGLPCHRHHPVTLPVEEACESLKVVLAGLIKRRREFVDMLDSISIQPTHFRLAYLPFYEDQHDYIQPRTRIALNKSLLSLSRNL